MLIDYDELDSLLDGLEYLGKLDWSVTPLPGFDAVYTTKGGFRAAAFGSRRTGNIEFAVRSIRVRTAPLVLSRDQLGQVRSLVRAGQGQARFLAQSEVARRGRFPRGTPFSVCRRRCPSACRARCGPPSPAVTWWRPNQPWFVSSTNCTRSDAATTEFVLWGCRSRISRMTPSGSM